MEKLIDVIERTRKEKKVLKQVLCERSGMHTEKYRRLLMGQEPTVNDIMVLADSLGLKLCLVSWVGSIPESPMTGL